MNECLSPSDTLTLEVCEMDRANAVGFSRSFFLFSFLAEPTGYSSAGRRGVGPRLISKLTATMRTLSAKHGAVGGVRGQSRQSET